MKKQIERLDIEKELTELNKRLKEIQAELDYGLDFALERGWIHPDDYKTIADIFFKRV